MYKCSETRLCPVCNSKKRSVKYAFEYLNVVQLEIVECLSCGTYYVLQPLMEELLFRYYDFYDEIEGPTIAHYTISAEKRRDTFLANLPHDFNAWEAWLDVGCGSGFMLRSMGNLFRQAVGIDPSESFVKFASSNLNVQVKHGFLTKTSFSHASFDHITFFDVLEHVINPKDTILAAFQLLKSNGWILITTPNLHSLSRVILGKYWRFFTPLQHLTYFHTDALKTLLECCGFCNFKICSSTREDIHPVIPLFDILKARAVHREIHMLEEARLVRALGTSYNKRSMDQTPANSKMHNTRFKPFCKLVYRMIAFPIEQLGGVLTNLFGMTDGLWVWAQKK